MDLWDEDDDIIDSADADQYLVSFHNSYNIATLPTGRENTAKWSFIKRAQTFLWGSEDHVLKIWRP